MTGNDRNFLELSLDLLRQGYSIRFRPAGRSMFPTIKDGEAICVAPISPRAIRRGDIILYRLARGVIAHRVLRSEEKSGVGRVFITRGDASGSEDPPILPEEILGRVTAVERAGKNISLAGRWPRWYYRVRVWASCAKGFCLTRQKPDTGQ